jgi:hypothetical protein
VCAAQLVWSVIVVQTSGATHTPDGHFVPAGHAAATTCHAQPFGSVPQSAAVVCAVQPVMSVAAICWSLGGACVKDDSQPTSPTVRAESAAVKQTI